VVPGLAMNGRQGYLVRHKNLLTLLFPRMCHYEQAGGPGEVLSELCSTKVNSEKVPKCCVSLIKQRKYMKTILGFPR